MAVDRQVLDVEARLVEAVVVEANHRLSRLRADGVGGVVQLNVGVGVVHARALSVPG